MIKEEQYIYISENGQNIIVNYPDGNCFAIETVISIDDMIK